MYKYIKINKEYKQTRRKKNYTKLQYNYIAVKTLIPCVN